MSLHHHTDTHTAEAAHGIISAWMLAVFMIIVTVVLLIALFAWQPWADGGTNNNVPNPGPVQEQQAPQGNPGGGQAPQGQGGGGQQGGQ
jgi:hypothetical protein